MIDTGCQYRVGGGLGGGRPLVACHWLACGICPKNMNLSPLRPPVPAAEPPSHIEISCSIYDVGSLPGPVGNTAGSRGSARKI